jgi:hypothetical protein
MKERFIVLLAFAIVVVTLLGCAKKIEAQEPEVFEIPVSSPAAKITSLVEWVEAKEEYEIKTTRWEPKTTIEKRERVVKKPVFVIQEVEQPTNLKLELNISELVGSLVDNVGDENGDVTVVSVPRVIKEGPLRTVQRNDNMIVVDGFEGTAGGVFQASRPTDGFGGVQVGLRNVYSQGDLDFSIGRDTPRFGSLLRRLLGR